MAIKILVVDDEKHVLDMLDIELKNAGYQAVKAMSGKEAIERAKECAPRLIIMDVILPDMNGAEAVKAIKKEEAMKDTPVIFLTAMLTKEEESQQHLEINVSEHDYESIAKPFDHRELLLKIKQALKG